MYRLTGPFETLTMNITINQHKASIADGDQLRF